jgi:hypothetical protein
VAEVQRQPDQDHVEDQAELAQEIERRQARVGEERGVQARRDPTEQRWTEGDARGHFPGDLGLAEFSEQSAEKLRGESDDADLKKQQQMLVLQKPSVLLSAAVAGTMQHAQISAPRTHRIAILVGHHAR